MLRPQLSSVPIPMGETSAMNSVQLPLASMPLNEFRLAVEVVAGSTAGSVKGLTFRPSGWKVPARVPPPALAVRNFQKWWMAGVEGHPKGRSFKLLLPWG